MTYHRGAHLVDKSHGCFYPISLFLLDHAYNHPCELMVGCNHRFDSQCPECSKLWRHKNFSKFNYGINEMNDPRMLTLTLEYDKSIGICENIKRIWGFRNQLFKELARGQNVPQYDPITGKRIKGKRINVYKFKSWVAIIELPNHIHLVFDGEYIPQAYISDLWFKITGNSMIVDIRRVRTNGPDRRLSGYLSKYLSKLAKLPKSIVEDLKGFHLFQSHGLGYTPKNPFIIDYKGFSFGANGWSKVDREIYEQCLISYHDDSALVRKCKRLWAPKSDSDRGPCPPQLARAFIKYHQERGLSKHTGLIDARAIVNFNREHGFLPKTQKHLDV